MQRENVTAEELNQFGCSDRWRLGAVCEAGNQLNLLSLTSDVTGLGRGRSQKSLPPAIELPAAKELVAAKELSAATELPPAKQLPATKQLPEAKELLDSKEAFRLEGKDREFEMHLPRGYDGKSAVPVVYMLHGLTENMEMMKEYSHMNQVADEKGFAVVYLQALPQNFPGSFGLYSENSWNLEHGTLTAKDSHYDDLNYVKAVKASVESQISVDSHRQYLVGFSEGGEAAQFIAHEMPKTFAGVATVHSTLLESDPRPLAGDPTAMISVLGNDDNVLPLHGGHGWGEDGALKGFMTLTIGKISQSQPLAQAPAWAAADGDRMETKRSANNEDITDYTGGSAPVEQIVRLSHRRNGRLEGGQHAWDGGNGGWAALHNPDLIQRISKPVRKPDPDFDTSRVVIDYLIKFAKP
jgi:poly(3-hydroxybutyrate) depolymerase